MILCYNYSFSVQVLYLTEPDKWSAAAMFQATRIFVSNLNVKMAQRYVCRLLSYLQYVVNWQAKVRLNQF